MFTVRYVVKQPIVQIFQMWNMSGQDENKTYSFTLNVFKKEGRWMCYIKAMLRPKTNNA